MTTDSRKLASMFAQGDLPGQWLIASDTRLLPSRWQSTQLGEFHVAWSAPLPCTPLRANGETFGVILGWYIADGSLLGEVRPSAAKQDRFDQLLALLSGNFVCLIAEGRDARFYLDACGSLSAFYCPDQRCVSSNIFLIPDDKTASCNRRYEGRFGIPATNCMFPVGMTPRMDVERLLPNHYLDLTNWKPVRHWPKVALTETADLQQTVAEIGELTARNISAVASSVPIHMSLTAGRDSRMLLACARPWAREASFFTSALPDRTGRLDVHVAKRLAKKLGLRHRVLPFAAPGKSDADKWLYRTSVSVGERRGFQEMRTLMQLEPDRAYLPGLVAELARGYYWHVALDLPDRDDRKCLSKALLQSMNAPVDPYTVARITQWISGLPDVDLWTLLDLFYLEQRLGCWGGVISYAYADMVRFESWPLNSRRLVALMLSLPVEYKAAARLNDDVIRIRWPELANVPYNKGDLAFRFIDPIAHPFEEAARLRLLYALAHPLWAARKIGRKLAQKPSRIAIH
jgi:hypothetical protein